jgi:phage terminase small subunit
MQGYIKTGIFYKQCDIDKVVVRLQKAACELGLSPSARSRVHAKPKEKLQGKAGRLNIVG